MTKPLITNKKISMFVFALFAVSLTFTSCFHEPWYDEAQAWQIAKCANIRDILLYVPHYEGHPPLWHLLLALPAKLGIPYEFGLKGITMLAVLASGWLIIFRSPFPMIVRYLLPFHYFLFYQYGVVSRPYAYMALLFLLMAMAFPKRNQKPWLFVCLLMLQCLLSAYGIVLAGSIALAWCLEIMEEEGWSLSAIWKEFLWKDKRVFPLACLLALAILILLEISPNQDTVIAFARIGERVPWCFLYTFFMVLPDSSVIMAFEGEGILRYYHFGTGVMMAGIFLGVCMLVGITAFAGKKMLKYFWIPYLGLAAFSAIVYFAVHHMGIAFLFTIFWFWIQTERQDKLETGRQWKQKLMIRMTERDRHLIERTIKLVCLIPVVIPVAWTIFASVLDFQNPYFYGRDAARFLIEHGMEHAKMMSVWSCPDSKEEIGDAIYEEMNTSIVKLPIAILPYLDKNTVQNLNLGAEDKGYVIYRVPTARENREVVSQWKEFGPPEVILGSMNVNVVFGDACDLKDYTIVYYMHPLRFNVWKMLQCGEGIGEGQYIYLRNDCKEKYGF